MDSDTFYKFLGGGAIGVAIILALTKMFKTGPFKKNGNGRDVFDEALLLGREIAESNKLQVHLLTEIHEFNKKHADRLESLHGKLDIAMERQIQGSHKLDKLSR